VSAPGSGPVAASVVIAAFSGEGTLVACLAGLEAESAQAEVIVVGALEPALAGELRRRFPWAELLAAPAALDVFQLRALGVARAAGRIVVLLEDHCVVGTGWLAALRDAVEDGGTRWAGGAVESGLSAQAPAWALYLVEYGALMPPLGGDGGSVLAVNAAYRRDVLESCRAVWEDGFHDNEVHDALRALGHEARIASPAATVRSDLRLPLGRAAGHLFAGGRRFGAYRRRGWTRAERLARILAAPLVPALLIARIFGRVLARRPARLPRVVAALPHLACLVAAWSAGEWIGHLDPSPGGTR